jgi:hypothetical protein
LQDYGTTFPSQKQFKQEKREKREEEQTGRRTYAKIAERDDTTASPTALVRQAGRANPRYKRQAIMSRLYLAFARPAAAGQTPAVGEAPH